jgi:maltooligosyltrehalose trehalohydrolase
MWNDDFHHSARVAVTGNRDGYFHDHSGSAQELVSAVKHGFLFQGQYYFWQKQPRGSPALGRPAHHFVAYIQNHDQVANTFYGQRITELTSPAMLRAITTLLLLAPHTPMLFMGQEFGAREPFPFFADHREELREAVRRGRAEFMRQFQHYATPEAQAELLDPGAAATYESAKLDFSQRQRHAPLYALHRDLLKLRREDAVLAKGSLVHLDGAVLSEQAFLLRWLDAREGDRLLIVNLGADLQMCPMPEPLLAPPRDTRWQPIWASEDPRYGGPGAIDPFETRDSILAASSATFYAPAQRS